MKKTITVERIIDLCDLCGKDFEGQLGVPVAFDNCSLFGRLKERAKIVFFGSQCAPDRILHMNCLLDHLKKTIPKG